MKISKTRRKRGVLLTPSGLQRLQTAILAVEIAQNGGNHFSLEQLSARIQISTKTLSRLWSLNASVDQRTLKMCFSTFGLELATQDYTISSEVDGNETGSTRSSVLDNREIYSSGLIANSCAQQQLSNSSYICSYPDGPVALDSRFYIERQLMENLARQEITQPGSVVRIRAPREMGKSSLVLRLLAFAQQQGYDTVKIDCNQIDLVCLNNFNYFFRCFCLRVAKELGIEPNLDANWDEEIGSKLSCFFYWKNYLLGQIKSPLVLVLEQADRLFEYPQLASEFFSLLRSWYEEARRDINWQKLRLVVVYSTEACALLDINRSPFNIGLPVLLNEFTTQQVEQLAQRHGLHWSPGKEAHQLMSLVGGHPALIRIALYHLCNQEITLEELVREAIANGGIYRSHLQQYWVTLQKKPNLVEAYTKVVTAKPRITLAPIEAYNLESLGLICIEGDRIKPRCQLYDAYFKKQLASNETM